MQEQAKPLSMEEIEKLLKNTPNTLMKVQVELVHAIPCLKVVVANKPCIAQFTMVELKDKACQRCRAVLDLSSAILCFQDIKSLWDLGAAVSQNFTLPSIPVDPNSN